MAQNEPRWPASKMKPALPPFDRKKNEWTGRVSYAENGTFAFRPRQLLVAQGEALEAAVAAIREQTGKDVTREPIFTDKVLLIGAGDFDVESIVRDLRMKGLLVEPNHVLFAHSAGGCSCQHCCGGSGGVGANPFMANPFMANPFMANPFMANPFMANPFMANPFMANPFMANPFMANPFMANYAATGVQQSSAIPVDPPAVTKSRHADGPGRAIILDTGIALVGQLPNFLKTERHRAAHGSERDRADEKGDGFLDPVAGHGTFIAGIIERLAPDHDVQVFGVLSSFGDGDVATISKRIDDLRVAGELNANTVLNLSFGSYADAEMHVLAEAIRLAQDQKAVVVASAGNDGVPIPSFPAVLPGVVSVGSIGECGREPYSNYGCWVRACAPGSSVVSGFFSDFVGDRLPLAGERDPDNFTSWAEWTGTSFAAPLVVAALLRHMSTENVDANTAVEQIIDNPLLGRFPGLGTVVNLTASP